MKKRNLLRLLTVLISCISACHALANGFGLPDQDAFATARGEAFVATADNASAIYYNPAGIAQLTNSNFRGGVYGIYFEPSYRPTNNAPNHGHTYYSSDNFAAIPQFFYTYTAKGAPLSVGLGIYSPYGGNMNWPQDTGFRSVAISGSLKYVTINPVVAVKLSPSLSVGGGAMVNYAKLDMHQGLLSLAAARGTNFFNFTGDGWSVGYNVGVLWQPLKQISFGATFRSSATMKFQGNTDFQLQPRPYPAPAHRSAEAELTFPLTTVFGVSYRPTPKWNLEVDANYTDWSSFGTTTIKQSPPVKNPFQQDVPVNLNWQASWMYEFGVTRYFDNGWHASAGYVFNQNSVPNKYYSPLAADMDRHFFSIGAGHAGKTFDFDLAYQFGYGPTHKVTGSTPSSTPGVDSGEFANGKYGFTSSALIVSVGMHF